MAECIDEEIPYDLPLNWVWVRLGTIVRMTIGKTPARGDQRYWSNGEYSWVSISDMKDLGVISATKERISAIAVKELIPQFGIIECLIQYKCSVNTPPPHANRSG